MSPTDPSEATSLQHSPAASTFSGPPAPGLASDTVRRAQTDSISVGGTGPTRYDLVREVGRGGMGVVYEARDRELNRVVALKMVLHEVRAGSAVVTRFLAEAEALAAVLHPNVVQVFDRGEHDGLPYFTMEFCPGGSLADRVREDPGRSRSTPDSGNWLSTSRAHLDEPPRSNHPARGRTRDRRQRPTAADAGPALNKPGFEGVGGRSATRAAARSAPPNNQVTCAFRC